MGIAGADDAGVMRLGDGRALVQSIDFFTPIVDGPYDWGRITAANALSDLYAMGAQPLSALQLIGWPRDDIEMDVLAEVVRGGADVMAEAGCVIIGGHSIDDKEPKYGFAVTGIANEGHIMTNAAAQPGQALYLTKRIGTGIISTAVKAGVASEISSREAVSTMALLNRAAADAAHRIGVEAATDVTGFGLLGHLSEMVRSSEVSAVLNVDGIPLLPDVRELAEDGRIPGGTKRNLASVEPMVDRGDHDDITVSILADAQTSGGLLLAVDMPLAEALEQAFTDAGTTGWRIGAIVEREFSHGPTGHILLR